MSLAPEIKIAKQRLSVLEPAKVLGNVSAVCQQRGATRLGPTPLPGSSHQAPPHFSRPFTVIQSGWRQLMTRLIFQMDILITRNRTRVFETRRSCR